MINVSVRDHNLFDLKVMFREECQHIGNVIARVNDHRFARGLVADDRTIALQRPDRKDLMNHEG
jgi:hypothetical protein